MRAMAESLTAPAAAAAAAIHNRRRVDGVLLVDKPAGPSSNAVLGHVKRLFGASKAGHTGTLDPLASGLLPICFGEATKFARFLLEGDKRYTATVRFGIATATSDAEGEVTAIHEVEFDEARLRAALAAAVGPQLQVPPKHSALKHAGRPHYAWARAGIDVPRTPRDITIHALRLVEWSSPDAIIEIGCSKGTYVRAVATSLGDTLGCGAHLAALRRTGSGGFDVRDAVTVETLEALDEAGRGRLLRPVSALVSHLPRAELDGPAARSFRHGQPVALAYDGSGFAAVYAVGGPLIGVADHRQAMLVPVRLIVGEDCATS